MKTTVLVFQFNVDVTGDTVLFPEVGEMDLFTNIIEIIIHFDVVGSHYGLCNLVIHGCAGKSFFKFNSNYIQLQTKQYCKTINICCYYILH